MQTPAVTPAAHVGDRFIRLHEVSWRTGLGKTAIYGRLKSGRFPPSVKLSPRVTVWRQSVIERWIEEQASAAKAAA